MPSKTQPKIAEQQQPPHQQCRDGKPFGEEQLTGCSGRRLGILHLGALLRSATQSRTDQLPQKRIPLRLGHDGDGFRAQRLTLLMRHKGPLQCNKRSTLCRNRKSSSPLGWILAQGGKQ